MMLLVFSFRLVCNFIRSTVARFNFVDFGLLRAKRVPSGRDVCVGSSAKWLQITGAPAKRGRNGSSLTGVQLSLG